MMRYVYLGLPLVALMVVGCASPKVASQPQSYTEAVTSRPEPQGEQGRASECAWIDSEIRRQQGGFMLASRMEPGSQKRNDVLLTVRANLGALEARAQKVGCSAKAATPNSP